MGALAQMIARGFAETATKEDIRGLESRIDGVDNRIDGLDNRVHALEQTVAEVLKLMREDRKERMAEIIDLQVRVAQLEKKIGVR